MSSTIVEFEVLPPEPDAPGEPSAEHLCHELHRQVQQPASTLHRGPLSGHVSRGVTMSLPEPSADSVAQPPPLAAPRGSHGYGGDSGWGPSGMSNPGLIDRISQLETQLGHSHGGPDHHPHAIYGGLTNAELLERIDQLEAQRDRSDPRGHRYPESEATHQHSHHREATHSDLLDRISQLEGQLARTASGERYDGPRERRGYDVDTLESRCQQLEQRVEAAERELRESEEGRRTERSRAQRAEQALKDRDELLRHAKEMWMKESGRASKLAEALTATEDRLADQEKRLQDVSDRYTESSQEVRQLRHILEGPDGAGYASGFGSGFGERGGHAIANGSSRDLSSTQHFGSSRDPSSTQHFGSVPASTHHAPRPPTSERALVPADLPGPPYMEAETNADRFRHLLLVNDAVLYEDDVMQIGVKAEYQGCEGQLAVYFGNKGTAPLQAFTVQYFVKDEQALRITASQVSRQLEPHDQIVQRVNASCFEPFNEAPVLRVQYLLPDASPRRVQTKFPLVLTKFMRGQELDQREFFRLWRLQHFVLNEVSNVVNLAPKLGAQPVHIARGLVFGGSLRLHHGFDTDPQNFVLVGVLHEKPHAAIVRDATDVGLGAMDDREMGLSLVRVEVGSGRFVGKARVVVRSGHRTVGVALVDLISTQLSITQHLQDGGK